MLSIVHLSDIHIKSNQDSIFEKVEKIVDALKNRLSESEKIVLVISGDIAYSGKESEYLLAVDILEDMRELLSDYTGLKVEFFIVPGNHDCDFSITSSVVRDTMIEKIIETGGEVIDQTVIEECCKPQQRFFDFLELFDNEIEIQNKLFFHKRIELGKYPILFLGFNTAWLSQLEENSQTIFPVKRFPKTCEPNNSDFVISVFHHPYIWLGNDSYREFRKFVENKSDIVLTGHEHVQEKRKYDDFNSNVTEYLESGAIQDSNDPNSSEFKLMHLDFDAKQQNIIRYHWKEDKYNISEETGWIKIDQIKELANQKYILNERYKKNLNDIGATFNHPRKSPIKLNDIFIHPDLKQITANEKKDKYEKVINSEEVLESITKEEEQHLIILGEEKSGKTTICKFYFDNLRNKGFIPVYIEGREIKSAKFEDLETIINESFAKEYSSDQLDSFKQEDRNKIILIIDNIDRSKLNPPYRNKLLQRTYSNYSKTIITGDDFFKLEELMGEKGLSKFSDSINRYEIREFGHLLRSKLINKWNELGRKEFIEEEQLVNINDRSRSAIDTVIGKNFVPSYPIFLLTILQTLELGNPSNLQASSYGHYYEFLITQSLNKVIKQHEELEAIKSYLTELARKFHKEEIREIKEIKFKEFHKWYCEEYAISPNFTDYKDKLESSSILEDYDNKYFFKYKYVYYFFTARYFANNISEKLVKDEIKAMAKEVHKEEYANILMFLTHLSKDPFIINELLENSKSIFKEVEILKLENDVEALNNILDEIPRILLEDKDYRESREEKYKLKDEIEYENSISEDDINKEDEGISTLGEFNKAYKSLEILGQILKNYYGSLKGTQKLEIGEEAYKVGLRALKSFFQIIENNSDAIVDLIKRELEKKEDLENRDEREIEKKSREIFFKISSIICYSFIKKISSSIGYDKLEETFNSILRENNYNSVKLVDASIKLDYQKGFPEEEIKKLNQEFKGNLISKTLLKRLVVNYLYMFPTDFKRKQKICSILDIPMSTQRAIESKSSRKKE